MTTADRTLAHLWVSIYGTTLASWVADIVTKAMIPVKVVRSMVIVPSDGITSCAIKANGVNNIANKNNNLFISKTFNYFTNIALILGSAHTFYIQHQPRYHVKHQLPFRLFLTHTLGLRYLRL